MNHIKEFKDLLKKATEAIDDRFFNLPVAGQKLPLYRERVYCYELYHQLRSKWPTSLNDYTISGEIDKSGHHLISNNVIPDLLIHIPGKMENNLAIIEIKPANYSQVGLKKDLIKLTDFRRDANYDHAIHLTYGSEGSTKKIIEKAQSIEKEYSEKIELSLIEFWTHFSSGEKAQTISK